MHPASPTVVCGKWDAARVMLVETEARMVTTLDEFGLTELVTSIEGPSLVGVAAILAETGDPHRFTSAGPWSSTAGSRLGNECRAPSQARRCWPEPAARPWAAQPGERCGYPCRDTACTPPGAGTRVHGRARLNCDRKRLLGRRAGQGSVVVREQSGDHAPQNSVELVIDGTAVRQGCGEVGV